MGSAMRLCFSDPLGAAALGSCAASHDKTGGAGSLSFVWGALRGTGVRVLRRFGVGRPRSRQNEHRLRAAGGVRSLASSSPTSTPEDLWLEDVDSDKALNWVRAQNANTFEKLGDPAKSPLYPRLKAIYESKDKIPAAVKRGNYLYNFWQDAENPRGIWRRTSWEEYVKPSPEWELLLDVDKLGAEEGQSWVWQASILFHNFSLCLSVSVVLCLYAEEGRVMGLAGGDREWFLARRRAGSAYARAT